MSTDNTALALLREIYDDVVQGAIPNTDDPWWAAASAALAAPAQAVPAPGVPNDEITRLRALSVENILLDITPGMDGMGHEVYAKSVKDVEDKLSSLGSRLEDYELGITRPPAEQPVEANNDEVICPNCVHQFRAIPVNVQQLMLDAGFVPPFTAAPGVPSDVVLRVQHDVRSYGDALIDGDADLAAKWVRQITARLGALGASTPVAVTAAPTRVAQLQVDEAFLVWWGPYELPKHWMSRIDLVARDAWRAALSTLLAAPAQAGEQEAFLAWWPTIGQTIGQIAAREAWQARAARGAAQAAPVDAERYRLLRRGQRWSSVDGVGNALRADELDSAIDAALDAAQAAQGGK